MTVTIYVEDYIPETNETIGRSIKTSLREIELASFDLLNYQVDQLVRDVKSAIKNRLPEE